jgi:hypothetical protein
MTTEKTTLIETAARSAFTVLLAIAGHTLLGIVLGIAILHTLLPELRALGTLEGMPATRVPIGALLALPVIVANNWKVALLVATFAVAFPVGWFLVGKQSGVRRIVHRFLGEHRAVAVGLATDGLFAGLRVASGAVQQRVDVGALRSLLTGPLPRATEAMRDAPRIVRLAARLLLSRAGKLPALRAAFEAIQQPDLDLDTARRRTADALLGALDPRDFLPSRRPALLLLAAELLLFVAVKLLV